MGESHSDIRKYSRPSKRISLGRSVGVTCRTMGSALGYELDTENISSSGLLLVHEGRGIIPFNIGTLVELKVDVSSQDGFHEPIQALAKVVRTKPEETKKKGFGLQIVQIDPVNKGLWESLLVQLAKKQNFDEFVFL